MKNILSICIFVIFILCGCTSNEEVISKFSIEPTETDIYESKVKHSYQVEVYHIDNIVIKTVVMDKYELIDGKYDNLKMKKELADKTFSNEVFDVNGFSYSSEIESNYIVLNMTYDFEAMDVESLLINESQLIDIEYLNDNYEVVYSILKAEYIKAGLICEE